MIRIRIILLVAWLFFSSGVLAQLHFVENKGQWPKQVLFKTDFSQGAFFLENNGFTVLLHDTAGLRKMAALLHGHDSRSPAITETVTLQSAAYRMRLLGSKGPESVQPEKKQSSYNNYFIGNDPAQWASACRLFGAVQYTDVLPKTDLRYYTDNDALKYDFILRPGANPEAVLMKYEGVESLRIRNRELLITTAAGDVRELVPYSYQIDAAGQRKEIACRFKLDGDVVSFVVGDYDRTQTLIIDPTVIFSSFTGSTSDNWGYTATPGPDGSLFAGGVVFGNGFPVSPGAFQTTFGGGVDEGTLKPHDIAIFKFNPLGTDRLYATYLGGSGNEQPHSMIVDAQGNLVVAGRSFSSNFPTTRPLIGPGGNNDIIITKFNAAGTALLGSVRIGGSNNDGVNIRSKYEAPDGADRIRRNYGDDARSEVILDAANNIILASCTQSPNFPTAGASLNSNGTYGGGFQDGLILKFSPDLNTYIYGSFFGGSGDDACFVASVRPGTSDIYVAGGTTSTGLPGTSAGVVQAAYNGGATDGFVTAVRLDGSGVLQTTFMGTSGIDMVYGLKFDRSGFPYVMGTTTGNWPVLNATYVNPNSAQFISKLRSDLSDFVYSTTFGTGTLAPNISPIGFLVDRCENVYVTGWGGGINVFKRYTTGSTSGLPILNPLSNVGAPDGEDLYFLVLKKNAEALLFASNFGQFQGVTGDHVDGGTSRFDENGVIYQAVCANCNGGATFPTTVGAWRRINGSTNCNQAAVKVEMNFTGVSAAVQPSINAVVNDTAGCVPFRVDFRDTLQRGKTFYWDFGNGRRDTTRAPQFATFTTYTSPGLYTVRVISEDSTTCNIRDTIYLKIKAGDNRAFIDFRATKDTPCTSLNYSFQNLSVPDRGTFGPQSFVWNFGDGSAPVRSLNANHTFPAVGIYTVTLTLEDSLFCNAPDKKVMQVNVNPLLEAKLQTPAVGCAPYRASFTNLSGTADVTWQFSDGTSTNVENPVKLFAQPGTYQVRIIARDPNTCNKIDTSDYFSIIVADKPDASFSWQPNPPVANTPVQFTNLSTGAVRYQWDFGDGSGSTQENPRHLYNETGLFTVRLVAYNQYNCTDTFSIRVRTLINPLLDVPNAFTPGRFGENAQIAVRGFGITRMEWKIYNRWGQLVFQTNDPQKAWDGTVNGKPQPMDVYTYTLEASFSNGKSITKTGDITLIR